MPEEINNNEITSEIKEPIIVEPVKPVEPVEPVEPVVVATVRNEVVEIPYLYHATQNPRGWGRYDRSMPNEYKRAYRAIWATPNMTLEEVARAANITEDQANVILNYYTKQGYVNVAQKPSVGEKILVINVPINKRYSDEYQKIKEKEKEKYDYLHGYSRVSIG